MVKIASLLCFLILLAVSLAQPDCSREMDAEVLILGAGFAGLGAAQALTENGINDFILIEARGEVGGRAQAEQFGGVNVDIGPQWLFFTDESRPETNPLYQTALRCNTTLRAEPLFTGGFKFYSRDGRDIDTEVSNSIARFDTAVTADVAGQIVQDIRETNCDLSTTAGLRVGGWTPLNEFDELAEYLRVDLPWSGPSAILGYQGSFEPEFIAERRVSLGGTSWVVVDNDGYRGMAQCLADEIFGEGDPRRRLLLNSNVEAVEWSKECVCVTVAGGRQYCGRYVILTFSVGVLQNGGVRFEPSLPTAVNMAINKLQMGRFLKIYAEYSETFWDTDVDFIGIANEIEGRDYYPLWAPWGAFFPSNASVIETFLFGDAAERIDRQDREITRLQMGQVLRNVYGESVPDPIRITVGNYQTNPYFYGNVGGVTSPGVSNETYQLLNEPIGNLYLAGDSIAYSHRSLAHGAMINGITVGNRVANALAAPPVVTFINDSPRVSGRTISAEFIVSKDVETLECILERGGIRQNCSSGSVVYDNLAPGTYWLKVIARNPGRNDRGVTVVDLFVSDRPHCAVHLINSGVRVSREGKATVDFTSSGTLPVPRFSCNVDGVNIFPCASPLQLDDLRSGLHRVRIAPVCAGARQRIGFTITIP